MSLERLSVDGEPDGMAEYRAKGGGPSEIQRFDPLDFVARLLMHAPEQRRAIRRVSLLLAGPLPEDDLGVAVRLPPPASG